MSVAIRRAVPDDAEALVALIDGLNAHVGAATGRMTRDVLLRDAFGDRPGFEIVVAEVDGTVAGYAAWCDAYETEHALAGLYMIDLFVGAAYRRRGLARRLVAAVSAETRARGRGFVWWTAEPGNADAAAFYEDLGSRSEPMIAHALFGARFEALADEA